MWRPGSRNWWTSAGLILFLFFAVCAVMALQVRRSDRHHRLVVTAGDAARPLLEAPVWPGSQFVVRYAHSQTGGPMEMWFTIGPDFKIVLSEIRAKVLRPEIEELTGYAREVVKENGWTIYRGLNQVIDPLFIRVRVSGGQHSLVLNGNEIPLRSIAEAGTRLELRVR
ncbi:MAG: hypothetical protein PWR07_1303 [Bacillota bacterium]|nr:hypothetical protein [Bacillota bacterium]